MEPLGEFAELMRRVQEGDREAAELIHKLYAEHIRRAVRRRLHERLRSKFDSLDFVQDVWASFFADAPDKYAFETPEELIGFLTAIARHKVNAATRKRHSPKYDVTRERSADDFPEGADRYPAEQPTPSEIVMSHEEWQELLRKQPLVYRRILLLLREGKNYSAIAEELNISLRTVTRVVHKVLPGYCS